MYSATCNNNNNKIKQTYQLLKPFNIFLGRNLPHVGSHRSCPVHHASRGQELDPHRERGRTPGKPKGQCAPSVFPFKFLNHLNN